MSVNSREPLARLCLHPDAQKKINGLSLVPPEIITLALTRPEYWIKLNQVIKTCKPIVDVIGNLEYHECNLADCMLKLIRCTRQLCQVELVDGEDAGFFTHAKSVFNSEFHAMNTNLHSLALFLHLLCCQLAISQAMKSWTFEDFCKIALKITQQWKWSSRVVALLLDDLRQYRLCKGLFVGGKADVRQWWEELPTKATSNPLKTFAIQIFLIVPHAAEVKRLFLNLGGIQSVKRCNLTVENFEKLGRLCNSYSYEIEWCNKAQGKSTR